MWNFIKKLLTFNGFFIVLGVLGGISSILTVFISSDTINAVISLKWLIFYVFISIIIYIFLLKLVYDIYIRFKNQSFIIEAIKVIRFIPDNNIFLINKVEQLGNDALVTLYYKDDDYEIPFGYGNVINIQEKIIQIKLIKFIDNFDKKYNHIIEKLIKNQNDIIKNLKIKTYLSYSVISEEDVNEQ